MNPIRTEMIELARIYREGAELSEKYGHKVHAREARKIAGALEHQVRNMHQLEMLEPAPAPARAPGEAP